MTRDPVGDLVINLDERPEPPAGRRRAARPGHVRAVLTAAVAVLAVGLGGPEAVTAEPRFAAPLTIEAAARSFTLAPETMYVHDALGTDLVAYRLSDGRRLWSGQGPEALSAVIEAGDVVLAVAMSGTFALDPRTGAERWRTKDRPIWVSDLPVGRIATARTVLAGVAGDAQNTDWGTPTTTVTVRESATGRVLYERPLVDGRDTLLTRYDGASSYASGVLIGDREPSVLFDFASFRETPLPGIRPDTVISLVDDLLLVSPPGSTGRLEALDAGTLRRRWSVDADVRSVKRCGQHLCAAGDGQTVALDRSTGAVRWRIPGEVIGGGDRRSVTVDLRRIQSSSTPVYSSIRVVDTRTGRVLQDLGGRWSAVSLPRFGDRIPVVESGDVPAPRASLFVFDLDRLRGYPLGAEPVIGGAAACRATATHIACPTSGPNGGLRGIRIWRYTE